jgi:hypothetical protein
MKEAQGNHDFIVDKSYKKNYVSTIILSIFSENNP